MIPTNSHALALRIVVVMLAVLSLALPVLLGPGTAAAATSGPLPLPRKILILGDSYSAGTGGGQYEQPDVGCHRSARTWGEVLGTRLGAIVVNRACNGAVAKNLLISGGVMQGLYEFAPDSAFATSEEAAAAAAAAGCTGVPKSIASDTTGVVRSAPTIWWAFGFRFSCKQFARPQLDWVDSSYDLVVLTIGGNDAGFGDIGKKCLIGEVIPGVFRDTTECSAKLDAAQQLLDNGSVASRIRDVLDGIRRRLAPGAQIVISDYPYLIENRGYRFQSCSVGCTPSLAAGERLYRLEDAATSMFRSVVSSVSTTITAQGCAYRSVVLADATKAKFAGHEPTAPLTFQDSGSWWINPLRRIDSMGNDVSSSFDESIHPKPEGYRAFASSAYDALRLSGCGARLDRLGNVLQVTAGDAHTCALMVDGGVRCWGLNAAGQLGNGTRTSSTVPVAVLGIDDAVQIAAGASHTCARVVSGAVRCWGDNHSGQLGAAGRTDSPVPVAVTSLLGVEDLAAGDAHTCVLRSTGVARCWGANGSGQLGNGTRIDSAAPVEVSGVLGGVQLDLGDRHSCVTLRGGTVRCWGANNLGQLGIGTKVGSSRAVAVAGLPAVNRVSAGGDSTCTLLASGSVRCWGGNFFGQLGDGTRVDSSIPVSVSALTGGSGLALGGSHSCALGSAREGRCWGANGAGQLGDGTSRLSNTPVRVSGLTDGARITAGDSHTCVVLLLGTVRCWGSNSSGQLGDGTRSGSLVPVDVRMS